MTDILSMFTESAAAETKEVPVEDLLAPLCFTWKEKVNEHRLKYTIDHLEEYKEKIMSVGYDFQKDASKWSNLHKQLSTYLNASKNGVVDVTYHQTTPQFGRMFSRYKTLLAR